MKTQPGHYSDDADAQPSLFDGGRESDFERYDRENPDIWEMFKKFTFQAIDAQERRNAAVRVGARAVYERIRWQTMVYGNDQFKVNNNYTAAYARKFMSKYPEYAGIFQTRRPSGQGDLTE